MKIVLFSDTHCQHNSVVLPECDIAIFCGDMSGRGELTDIEDFLEWYSSQEQCNDKIFIAGNHDLYFDKERTRYQGSLSFEASLNCMLRRYPNLVYLNNNSIDVQGLKIWGSPITPWFYGNYWAFNKHRGEDIDKVWKNIPLDTDIVVTHGPVSYIHDYVPVQQFHAGCEELRKRIEEIKPRIHACGHIHEGYGIIEKEETIYVNASIMDSNYNPVNKPIELTITI